MARSAAASSGTASTARSSFGPLCGTAMREPRHDDANHRGRTMMSYRNRLALVALQNAPILLFALLVIVFSLLSGRFLTPVNFLNILNQSAHIAIIAIGMTFVLLIAGIDLSVGANMYVSAVLLNVFMPWLPPIVAFPVIAVFGLAFGMINAFFITQMRVAAFI